MGSRRCILRHPLRNKLLLLQRLRWRRGTLLVLTTCRDKTSSGLPTALHRIQMMTTAVWPASSPLSPTSSSSSPSPSPSGAVSRWSRSTSVQSFSDSVTVSVDAVVYYQVSNPLSAICNNDDYNRSTRLLAATTLRNILGTRNLSEILAEREDIGDHMHKSLEAATDPWGVHVDRVEIKDVRLPQQMQRAMAAEAESTRDARAKVIASEGEQKAAKALKEAADVISQSPAALQLRYLQTLNSISAEKNSTIIFPLPME